jgi:hypothetical protein
MLWRAFYAEAKAAPFTPMEWKRIHLLGSKVVSISIAFASCSLCVTLSVLVPMRKKGDAEIEYVVT